jgi:hypothetical protein
MLMDGGSLESVTTQRLRADDQTPAEKLQQVTDELGMENDNG